MEAIKQQQHHHHHHHHHQGSLNRFMSLSFLAKKAIKLFLVSVSIFSIIFSFSFSSYAMQVIANNIDKSYMFLLCNGILVFVVKNSARLIEESQQESDNSSDLINEKKTAKKRHNYQPEVVKFEKQSIVKEVVKEEAHQETEGKQEEQEQENHEALIIAAAEESNYVQEEVTGLISTEELNKKCEEFIRKMKKQIKFGSQQQLNMV
ncbi:hypothetical protein Ddye_015706 [Dipteronia dyeriana]|uniref:Transmembrane protein n=1 Tax=Dipteronia dyeriana TaxID=168575 RepID=A0AAD9U5G5_9ROSI|nr:hypothetical protein Ddye_015706 [Dipteronia dyeriana]